MAEKIKVLNITPEQKRKRIVIQNRLYELMDKLDLTDSEIKNGKKSFNRELWEKRFANMNDFEFHDFMKRIYEERDFNFSYEAESFDKKEKMTITKVKKIAKDYNIKLMEHVIYPHKNRQNPSRPMVSRTPLMIIIISVKRLQQMLMKKNKVSSSGHIRNEITNTVTGDDKGGKMSNAQVMSLIVSGQESSIKEFLSIRADDQEAKRKMMMEIESSGKAHLSNYNLQTSNKQSLQAMEVFLKGAGLHSNILEQDSESTKRLNKKRFSNENLILDDEAEKTIPLYKMLICGISDDEKNVDIIEKFRPKIILHEDYLSGKEEIDAKTAEIMIKNNNIYNYNKKNIKYLLELVIKLNCKLIGMGIEEKENTNYSIKESMFLDRIINFYHLDSDDKIAVVLNKFYLNFFKTNTKNKSYIVNYFKNSPNVVIYNNINKNFDKLFENFVVRFVPTNEIKVYKNSKTEKISIFLSNESKKINEKVGFLIVENDIKIENNEDLIIQNLKPNFLNINLYREYRNSTIEKIIISQIGNLKSIYDNMFTISADDSSSSIIGYFKKDDELKIELYEKLKKDVKRDNLSCARLY